MNKIYLLLITCCFSCVELPPKITTNKFARTLPMHLRDVLIYTNCDSLEFEIGDTIEGKPDRHFHTQFYFQNIENDSLIFDYQVIGKHPGDYQESIDRGKIKLGCIKYKPPTKEEVRAVLDLFLKKQLESSQNDTYNWGITKEENVFEHFSIGRPARLRYLMNHQLSKDSFSIEEIEIANYKGAHHSRFNLAELDLTFFHDKKFKWINLSEIKQVESHLIIKNPIFNFDNTICLLSYDIICNKNDECGSGLQVLMKKENGFWRQVYLGGWES